MSVRLVSAPMRTGLPPGQGPWDRLDRFIAKHSDAKLTHTFCPECLAQYRKEQGLQ